MPPRYREILDDCNVRTLSTNIVHAPGGNRGGRSALLLCEGRVAASDIDNAGDEPVSCFWCITGIAAPDLRWFKWGDGT